MAITQSNIYESLTEQTAIALAIKLRIFEEGKVLYCKEIGDGNLNLVFHIYDQDEEKSIIIKQALPYAKVVGKSMPLTLQRATIESNALKLQASIVPDLVPKVYYTDESLAITIMEDLSHLTIVRSGLIDNFDFPILSKHIGEFIAKTLYHTSDYALHPFKKKELVRQFSNPELCKITEDLVFTDPFFNSESNDFEEELLPDAVEIWQDFKLKLEVAKLKKSFLTEAEALLHGDLHTGSIFADIETTKVIDPEFSFYGPIGFDIGQFFANLLFQYITSKEESKKEKILSYIENTWHVFSATFSELWKESLDSYTKVEGYLEYILDKSFKDSLGFTGCELIRRTIGLSHVKDLDGIEHYDERIQAKRRTLDIGSFLIKERKQFSSIDEVIFSLKTFSKERS
ncbi:5-methylthioribose kinase [Bacillus pakistanensis]|uniref:Methylthioribose kinase n=1 Tax=Rossellomorea pakistanensis TaxID=992288 RepID=A0ABS2NFG8_9BACI|nr:S-methyl-5-thioribose kinase [Bacillus pakistanensis]MBM7586606.1 5-methylthioribose kinase [Bacillus pakistanensis]